MSESSYRHIPLKGKIRKLSNLSEALSSVKDGGYLWIAFYDPSREELTALIEPLGIHPLSVDDCLDEDQVPKVENFPHNTFILFNCYSYSEKFLSIEEVDLFVGKNFIITVCGHQGTQRRFYDGLEEAVQVDLESVRKGPDFLLHVILDYTVDHKFSAIETIQEEIDAAEEKIINNPTAFKPQELLHLRRYLLALRKSLFHEREILVKICRRDSSFISEKSIYHFRDIYDHLAKFFEVIEIGREMITNQMEMYLSIINNQMAKIANKTNRTVSRLTLITTIFMPLTLLAGIGGMSEWTMMTGAENWKIAYSLFLVAMVILGIVNFFILKKLESKPGGPRKC